MKAALISLILMLSTDATARDLDGQYNDSPLKPWFDTLRSGKGLCCSFADGRTVEDPDWGTEGNNYWVNIDGQHIIVPPEALVIVPNRFGRAVVWPYADVETGKILIRCFMPGAGT